MSAEGAAHLSLGQSRRSPRNRPPKKANKGLAARPIALLVPPASRYQSVGL